MRKKGYSSACAVPLILLMLFMARPAFAQSGTGTITGLVKDAGGLVVPGVTVTATNAGTNIVTTTATNAEGLYALRNLPVGTYTVSFTLEGFKPYGQSGIAVGLGAIVTLDHTLVVGNLAESVTVSGAAPLLETATAEVGTSMTSQTVKTLPLDISGGRSILTFAYAVTPSVEGNDKNNTWNSHVAGGADFTNEVVVEGTSAIVQIGGWIGESSPPMEAVEEFKIQTSGIAAEYGRTAGGVFNFTLKSGTNAFHGSVLASLHNEALNANTAQNEYLKAANPGNVGAYEKPKDRQYMGSLGMGGPIFKNRTFFFGAVEMYTQSRFALGQLNQTVPTAAMLNGDFSALLNRGVAPLGYDAAGNPIYPGAIRDPITGNVFPNNVMPQNRISRVSQQIAELYRQGYAPQVDRLTNNSALTMYNNPYQAQQQFSGKVTHQISNASQLNGSVIYTRRPRTLVDAGGIWDPSDGGEMGGPLSRGRRQTVNGPQVRASHNQTFSSNLLNVASFSWGRYDNPSVAGSANGGWPQKLGFGDTGVGNFPEIQFGSAVNGIGESRIGYSSNAGYTSDAFIFADSVSWVQGRHTFKFGGEYRYMRIASRTSTGTLQFNFVPDYTRFMGKPWSNQTGFGFASFLLGGVNDAAQETAGNLTGRRNYSALYAQDDWRVGENLTFNLGLRWETTGPWSEKNGHWANYNTSAINPATGVPGLLEFAQNSNTTFEGKRDWKQFGPRVGVSYQLTSRAVLRGAYGIFYQPIGADYWAGVPYSFAPGFRATNRVSAVGNGKAAFNWDNGYPGVEVPPTKDANAIPWGPTSMNPQSLEGGRVQQWNAGVEFELTKDLVVGLNYLGNRGDHLHSGNLERNQPDMQALGNLLKSGKEWNWIWDAASAAAAGVPYPYPGFSNFAMFALAPYPQVAETYGPMYFLGSPFGRQDYKAFEVTFKKRYSRGLTGQIAYTLARAMTNMDTGFQETWDAGNLQDVHNLATFIAPFDRTHVLKGYVMYELPFGKGRQFLNNGGFASALVGGWDVSLIFRYESGSPLSVTSNNSYSSWNTWGIGYPIYVNRNASVDLSRQFDPSKFDIANPTSAANRYFDPAAFSNPAYGEFGKGPAYFEQLRSFGHAYEDLGVAKHFRLANMNGEFRLELLNLFNRTYFSDPVTDIGSAQFGNVVSTSGSPRMGQVSVRLEF